MEKKFAVRIEEMSSGTVIVEAEDWESARYKVCSLYYNRDIVLGISSYVDTDFIETGKYGRDPLPENSDALEYYDFVG